MEEEKKIQRKRIMLLGEKKYQEQILRRTHSKIKIQIQI